MKTRTNYDFSKHTHRVEMFTSSKVNKIRVDHFQEADKRCGYIKFVNDEQGLSVFGDFGNWIFCRPFIPSPEGYVSDGYWNEKLKLYSEQDHAKYDAEATRKEIEELINSGLEDYGYEGDDLFKGKKWFKDLLYFTYDEINYTYHAYRHYSKPDFIEYDEIPFVKKGSPRLEIIFYAFDEICNRLKNKYERSVN